MDFAEDYPNKPPVVKFVSPMFHPNSEHEPSIVFIALLSAQSDNCTVAVFVDCLLAHYGNAVVQSIMMAASAWTSCKTSGAPSTMWPQC